jgi:hypothetical protein
MTAIDDLRAAADQLAVGAAALAAALKNFNPNPEPEPNPPVPDPAWKPVSYGRFLHTVDTVFSVATQAARWPLQVVLCDAWHEEHLRALKATPGTFTLRYADPVARRAADPDGYGVCLPPGQIPDGWMLVNKNNQIISRKRDGDQFVDPGNPAYQAAVGRCLVDVCQRLRLPGAWLDEINPNPTHSFGDNQATNPAADLPTRYPTPYSYATAVRSFVKAVTGTMRAAGLQVWINLGGQFDPRTGVWDSWTKGLASETDGHCFEFFVARGGEPTASLESGYWKPMLDWLVWQAKAQCKAMYCAQTTDPALVQFALGTYLLAGGRGNSVFMAGRDPYRVPETVWTQDMINAQKLGPARGAYTVTGGIYSREFVGGVVRVNPSSAPVGGLDGTSATITLGS